MLRNVVGHCCVAFLRHYIAELGTEGVFIALLSIYLKQNKVTKEVAESLNLQCHFRLTSAYMGKQSLWLEWVNSGKEYSLWQKLC